MNNLECAERFRKLADVIQHPNMPQPWHGGHAPLIMYADTLEQFQALIKAVGTGKKRYDESWIWFSPDSWPELTIGFFRSLLCTRRVVGTRTIPEKVIPAHTEEIVEWDCEPILAGVDDE